MLCDNLEGWDGVGGEREFQEGGDRGRVSNPRGILGIVVPGSLRGTPALRSAALSCSGKRKKKKKREGTYVCLWLFHIVVLQKPVRHCKAIILQSKINLKKRNAQPLILLTPTHIHSPPLHYSSSHHEVTVCLDPHSVFTSSHPCKYEW